MRRLRDLGLGVGRMVPGRDNAITDVAGVAVGQVEVTEEGLHGGITAVVPYPKEVGKRQLFIGGWALDGGTALTGLSVAEDFGRFSTPIVLAPRPAVGGVYDALIQYGLARDAGLTTVAGWPPVVVGVDDTLVNPAVVTYRHVGGEELATALQRAVAGPVQEGCVGVGNGLCAFGYRGGIGTASRCIIAQGASYVVGVLVVANSGANGQVSVDRYPLDLVAVGSPAARPHNFVAVVATDLPLVPGRLERLAGRTALGLARVGLLDAETREGVVLAFSTEPPTQIDGGGLEGFSWLEEGELASVFAAAGDAVEEAVLNGLLSAKPLTGEVSLPAFPLKPWLSDVRRFQAGRDRG